MSEVYVFLGPTLPIEEARHILDATYLPPVEQGDVIRLLHRKPKAIGIVDGRFQFMPSVWHKEILAALAQGVHVAGAASMGALRAAELRHFGMVGIGRVFESYRSAEIEDDDEVAVCHADASLAYRETSDAMVNIRDTVAAAVNEGCIQEPAAQTLIALAKAQYFPERSWARIFELARLQGVDGASIANMDRFRRAHVPVKCRDAVELLEHLSQFSRNTSPASPPSFTLERTVFLDNLQAEAELDQCFKAGIKSDNEKPEVARKKVLLELLAVQEARRQGILITEADIAEMTNWFRSNYGLLSDADLAAWKAETGLRDDTLREMMQRFVAVTKVEQFHRAAIDRALSGHLRVTSARDRSGPDWLQMNVELSREANSARAVAHAFLSRLAALVETAREQGCLRRFFFVRKPPDIRLRFFGDTGRLLPMLDEFLRDCKRAGLIERHFQSVYEPEAALFGGPEAMEFVHDFFDADTRVWLHMNAYSRAYSMELLNELFFATLGCANETWQTWERLAEMTDPDAEPSALTLGSEALDAIHVDAVRALAAGLGDLAGQGRLRSGPRTILASVAMFHFNRYGVPGGEQAHLARQMVRQANPEYRLQNA